MTEQNRERMMNNLRKRTEASLSLIASKSGNKQEDCRPIVAWTRIGVFSSLLRTRLQQAHDVAEDVTFAARQVLKEKVRHREIVD